MARLIDANALPISKEYCVDEAGFGATFYVAHKDAIDNAPTVDAVSRGVHDQVRWERDVAMEQLEEHGIPFGGIAPDVVKVVRCKDCKHFGYNLENDTLCRVVSGLSDPEENDFCSYGEKRDDR